MVWKPGQSGNPRGRVVDPILKQFRDALKKVEKEKGISLIEHCIKESYVEPALANAILKKMLPDLQRTDVSIAGNVTLDHLTDNDLRNRIIELESLGDRGTVRSQEGKSDKKKQG